MVAKSCKQKRTLDGHSQGEIMATSPSPYPLLVDSLPNMTDSIDSLPNMTDPVDSLSNKTDETCEAIQQFPPLPSVVLSLLISILIVVANIQLITVIFCTRELRRQVLNRILKNCALFQLLFFIRDSTYTSSAWPSQTSLWASSSP